jgi:predicted metal-dependent peptidase
VTVSRRADREKVAAARLWAAHTFPYLAAALFASPVLLRPGIATVAIDDAWRLYVDPELVAGWSAEQLGALLVHHSGHLLRDHAGRACALGVDGRDTVAWVQAADAEINDDLPDLGPTLPVTPVMPRHLGCPEGRLAEEYFEAARARRPDGGPDAAGGRDGVRRIDCGSGADGAGRAWDEHGESDDGVSPYGAGLLRCQVASEICRQGREAGTVPLGLLRWAESVLRAKVDWRRVLAAELRRGITDVSGCVDYSYRRPSRRARSVGRVILPALRRPVPEVAVVCDTSGSMSDGQLAEVLAEVDGVLRSVGVRSQGVRVLSCDADVHRIQRVASARQVELVGGGGTNMGAGIDAAVRARPRPGVVVVLTDGHTPWPASPPQGVHVVVGLVGALCPAPPAWARAVRIDDR